MPLKSLEIMIADDHTMFANGLAGLLTAMGGHVCSVVYNGVDLVNKYPLHHPDVVLVDLNMPELNGLDASRQILKKHRDACILVLSVYGTIQLAEEMRTYGIKGYVKKNCELEELVTAIQKVTAGEYVFDPAYLEPEFYSLLHQPHLKKPAITPRELEVLKLIADGHTNPRIAEMLFVSSETVNSHRKNLLLKIGARNSVDLVNRCLRLGVI